MKKQTRILIVVLSLLLLALVATGIIYFVIKNQNTEKPEPVTSEPAGVSEPAMEPEPAAEPAPASEPEPAPASEPEPASDPARAPARIAVFSTSDIHGYLMDTTGGDESTYQYRMARIAKIVSDARTSGEYDDVLLVDDGDIYQGAPVSNLTQGGALRACLDRMHYDAVVLGNHEFDWDLGVTAQKDGTLAPYSFGGYAGDPTIPILACNLYDAETKERSAYTKDYVIVEKAGYRIALIGYIPDYSGEIMRSMIEPYAIDPITRPSRHGSGRSGTRRSRTSRSSWPMKCRMRLQVR